MKPVDTNKKYRTRDGFDARIYATDGCGMFPIHGAVNTEWGWVAKSYRTSDLIEVRTAEDVVREAIEGVGVDNNYITFMVSDAVKALRAEGKMRDGE